MKIGPMEIAIILVIVLMVFGVGKLPQVASSIGKSIKAFKEGQSREEEDEGEELGTKPRRRRKAARKVAATAEAEAAPAKAAAPEAEEQS